MAKRRHVARLVGRAAARRPRHRPPRAAATAPFAELNADANRLARALRAHGLGAGDGVAAMVSNRAEFVESPTPPRSRAGLRLTPVNWHLTARGGRLHRRRLRGPGARGRRPLRRRGRGEGGRRRAGRHRAAGRRRRDRRVRRLRRRARRRGPAPTSTTRSRAGRCSTRRAPPGGPRACTAPTASRQPPHDATSIGYVEPGESTAPVHRPPLPRRSAGVLAGHAAAVRRRRRADGRLVAAGDAAARSTSTASPTPTWSRPCSTVCCRCPDDERGRRRRVVACACVLHGAAPCPVAAKQAMIDWLGPVLVEYYAATEGAGSFVTSADWLDQPGHRRQAPHARPRPHPRRRRPGPARRRGRHHLPQGPGVGPVRLLQGPGQDRRQLPG